MLDLEVYHKEDERGQKLLTFIVFVYTVYILSLHVLYLKINCVKGWIYN